MTTTKNDNIVLVRIISCIWIVMSAFISLLTVVFSFDAVGASVRIEDIALTLSNCIPYIFFFIYIFLNKERRKKGALMGIFFVILALHAALTIVSSVRTIIFAIEMGIHPLQFVRQGLNIVSAIFNIITYTILAIDGFKNFRLAIASFIITIIKLVKGALGLFISLIFTVINIIGVPFPAQGFVTTGLSVFSKILSLVFLVILLILYKGIMANKKETPVEEPLVISE